MRMLRWMLVSVVGLVPAGSATAQGSDTDPLGQRVDRALAVLKTMQDSDGAFLISGKVKSHAVTSLAVMAYLSAGHVPGEGPYRDVIDKGLRWVLKHQTADGLLHADPGHEMYNHGISTLMLAEVAGMTDVRLGADIRKALEKAVKVIIRAQAKDDGSRNPLRGGWRYQAYGNDADTSVTGWQLLALRAAKNLGCDVPSEVIDRAVDYLRRCHDPASGGFCYQPSGQVTAPCTGTAILCIALCGDKSLLRSREVVQAGSYLLRHLPEWNGFQFFYGIYYGAQATFQLAPLADPGGTAKPGKTRNNYWEVYRAALHKVLFANQKIDGSWVDTDFGEAYGTAMAVLALTVEYRYLPIYQRHEGKVESGK